MKKISIDNIIAFVKKAMSYSKPIDVSKYGEFYEISIRDNDKWILFHMMTDDLTITTCTNCGHITVKLTEKEMLKFRLLCEECTIYQEENVFKDLSTFFDKVEDKPTNIDDLNDEE